MPPPRSRASSRPPPAHPKGPGQSTSRDGGASPTATARRAGAETRAPRKHPPSPPVPCRHSRPARPFATGATIGRARPAIGWFPHGRRDRSHDRRPPAIAPPPAAGEPRLQSRCSAFGTFVAGRRGQELADSPRVRTLALANSGQRLPRAREPLYPKPQDCSYDCAAAQCARLMQHLLPGRFRRLPVERQTCASVSPGDFDASRTDTANHPGPLSPRTAGCASASHTHPQVHRALRTVSSTAFQPGPVRSCRKHSAKPLDNFGHIAEHRLRIRARRAPMTRSKLCARFAARSSWSKADVAAALGVLTRCPDGIMLTLRPPRRRPLRKGVNTVRCALFPAASAIALLLAGCSTMNVTLEKTDDGPTVSAVATAPTSTSIKSLIEDTHAAMAAVCASEKGTQATVQFNDKVNEAISGATKAAKGVKQLLDAVRSWFPENTFTATRLCRKPNLSDHGAKPSSSPNRFPSDAQPS